MAGGAVVPRCAFPATALVALGAALLLGTRAAQAAAVLVKATPTRYAALTHPPHVIRLSFSEAIVRKSSAVTLTDLAGHQMRVTPGKVRGDSSLEVTIDGRLGPGVYMVHWTSVSAIDGSKAIGSYQFTIQ